jgi:hypothetical protein
LPLEPEPLPELREPEPDDPERGGLLEPDEEPPLLRDEPPLLREEPPLLRDEPPGRDEL